MGLLKILLGEDFRVMISTATTLLTVSVHIVPAQLPNDMLILALSASEAETHVEVRAALVHMPKWTMLTSVALVLDKVLTNFQIMTEITSLPIWALTLTLILLTSFYLTLVMRVGACLSLPALPMDELLAHSIRSQLGCVVGGDDWLGCLLRVVDVLVGRLIIVGLGVDVIGVIG